MLCKHLIGFVISRKRKALFSLLAIARTQSPLPEILLWTAPSEPPRALQASECSELLDPMRASCLILAQHQPGKFKAECCPKLWLPFFRSTMVLLSWGVNWQKMATPFFCRWRAPGMFLGIGTARPRQSKQSRQKFHMASESFKA